MRRSSLTALLAAGALVAALLSTCSTPTALAGPAWVAQTTEVAGYGAGLGGNEAPRIALNGRGDAVAVWETRDLLVEDAPTLVQTAFHPAGGTWSTPVTLSSPTAFSFNPRADLDAEGNAVAVWSSEALGDDWAIVVAERAAGEHPQDELDGWRLPGEILSAQGGNGEPDLAINPGGDAVATWEHWRPGTIEEPEPDEPGLQAAVKRAGGSWELVPDVSQAGFATSSSVGIDDQGNAVAVWVGDGVEDGAPDLSSRVRTASLPAGAAQWSEPVALSGGDRVATVSSDVRLDVAESGAAAAIWEAEADSPLSTSVKAALRPAGGGAWQVAELSGDGEPPRLPDVAVSSAGRILAAWWERTGDDWVVRAADRLPAPGEQLPAGRRVFEPDERICYRTSGTSSRLVVGPQVDLDERGNAVAAWARCYFDGLAQSIEASVGSLGSGGPEDIRWDAPRDLTTAGSYSDPQAAFDAAGNALLAWQGMFAPGNTIEARAYDAAGPQLYGLSIPPTGAVGEPLAFVASPLDVWSTVSSVAWDFGDGGGATGVAVGHSYAEPGEYQVRVTATDEVGNVTTRTQTLSVAAAAAPPPPTPPEPPPSEPPPTPPVNGGADSGRRGDVASGRVTPVQIADAPVSVTGGAVARVRIDCQPNGPRPCSGTLSLRTARAVKAGRRDARRAVTLGRARFSVAAGESGVVRVQLSRQGRRLLRRLGKIKAKVTVTLAGGGGPQTVTQTITLVARPRS